MIGAGKLQPSDIQLVVSLLQSGDVEPRQCAILSYGRGMDHLAIEHMVPLLEELALHGADGLWAVLDIISMILHGGKEPSKPLIAVPRNVLVDPALFENVPGAMGGHHLEVLVKLLSRNDLFDRGFARALVKQLLSICARSRADIFHELAGPVSAALRALMDSHPQEVWAGVARLLRGNDWRVRHGLETLIALRHADHLGPGLLYGLPANLYQKWAVKTRRVGHPLSWTGCQSRQGRRTAHFVGIRHSRISSQSLGISPVSLAHYLCGFCRTSRGVLWCLSLSRW